MEWVWKEIEEGRLKRSGQLKPLTLDRETGFATFKGSGGNYMCTLTHCTCQDFQHNLKGKQPCKHILCLGAALGVFNPSSSQQVFEDNRKADQLALAYGYYYLFDRPIIADEDYDNLKKELFPNGSPSKRNNSSAPKKKPEKTPAVDKTKEELTALLDSYAIKYVDKTDAGGCFWVEDTHEARELLRGVTLAGKKLHEAKKSRAFDNKAAIYYSYVGTSAVE